MQRWYKDHFGCDPLRLGIPFIEKKSQCHAGFCRLWKESDVIPYINPDKINSDAIPDCYFRYHNGEKIPKKVRQMWWEAIDERKKSKSQKEKEKSEKISPWAYIRKNNPLPLPL